MMEIISQTKNSTIRIDSQTAVTIRAVSVSLSVGWSIFSKMSGMSSYPLAGHFRHNLCVS